MTGRGSGAALRVLFLTTDFVWPPNSGGRIRTLSQLQVMSSLPQVGRIRFFSMPETEVGSDHRAALMREVPKLELIEPVFHPIHLFRHPRYVPRVLWLRAVRGVPYVAGKWDSPAVRETLRHELLLREFDVVWLDGLGIAHYLPLVRTAQPSARVVLDQHNVESDRFAQFARRQQGLRRLVAEAEWRAAERYERDSLRAVDAVGAISSDDARVYRQLAGVEPLTVPQVVPFARRAAAAEPEHRFCWVGTLTWEPNARGLDWFCREVWPRIRRRLPDAAFEIAGSGLRTDASGAVLVPPAWRAPGITTLGFVEDVTPVYERSAAMLVPTLGGTGIRMKLLEAFRNGAPVVTTPDGAAGLPIESGREAFVEAEADAFAARAVELATRAGLRHRLREAGYAFLERHNGFPEAQAVMRALLGSAPAPLRVNELQAS
jgi:glycosyltransferase involved in cell wall biosynthesis